MNLDTHAIVEKVYDVLRSDAKTAGIRWRLGVVTLDDAQQLPAGGVSLGSGVVTDGPSPNQAESTFQILLRILYVSEFGVAAAEELLQDALNAVLQVLWAKRSLDDWPGLIEHVLRWDQPVSNPEASPPSATVLIRMEVRHRS